MLILKFGMAATFENEKTLSAIGLSAKELPTFLKTAENSKSDANIVLMGRTGTGKSSLVNGLCGDQGAARVGHRLSHETIEASDHTARNTTIDLGADVASKYFSIKLWDSPGLFDGSKREHEYVKQVKVKCSELDLLVFCIDMSKTRCIGSEIVEEIELVNKILGPDVWIYAIIVLTKANTVRLNKKSSMTDKCFDFLCKLDHWEKKVREALICSGVDEITAQKIVIEPAGNYDDPHLPDRQH